MSTQIYIAHKLKTSNALYALIRSRHKRLQMLSKCVSSNSRITNAAVNIKSVCWQHHGLSRRYDGSHHHEWNLLLAAYCYYHYIIIIIIITTTTSSSSSSSSTGSDSNCTQLITRIYIMLT